MKKFAAMILVVPFLLLPVGCSSSKPVAKLSGKVTFEGKPATFGLVQVNSEDGKQQGKGEIDENGNYEVKNSPIGKVKIVIIARDPGGSSSDQELAKGGGGAMKDVKSMPDASKADQGKGKAGAAQPAVDPAIMQKRYLTIKDFSKKYEDINSSPLTTTVEAGGTTYDIKLTKTGN